MTFRDLIADTIQTLLAHKMRAGLTMFGLMWGVVSITLMTAAGDGLREGQAKVARQFGENIAIVFPGRTSLQAGGERAVSYTHLESFVRQNQNIRHSDSGGRDSLKRR